MKKIMSILLTLALCFSLSSCITTAQAQIDDMYDSYDISMIVTYGIPQYNTEGLVLYYLYKDLFYYPFFRNNRYYFRAYRRPLPPSHIVGYRPIPRDYHFGNPPRKVTVQPNRGSYRVVPNTSGNRNTYHINPITKDDKRVVVTPNKEKEPSKPNTVVVPNRSENRISVPSVPNTNRTAPTVPNSSSTRISVPQNRVSAPQSQPRTSARTMSGRR